MRLGDQILTAFAGLSKNKPFTLAEARQENTQSVMSRTLLGFSLSLLHQLEGESGTTLLLYISITAQRSVFMSLIVRFKICFCELPVYLVTLLDYWSK